MSRQSQAGALSFGLWCLKTQFSPLDMAASVAVHGVSQSETSKLCQPFLSFSWTPRIGIYLRAQPQEGVLPQMGRQHLGACPLRAETGWLMWLEPVLPAQGQVHPQCPGCGGAHGTKPGADG